MTPTTRPQAHEQIEADPRDALIAELVAAAKEGLAALNHVFPFAMDAKDDLRLAIAKAERTTP